MATGVKVTLTRKPAITDVRPDRMTGQIDPRTMQAAVDAIRKRLEDIELAFLSSTGQLNQTLKTMPASAASPAGCDCSASEVSNNSTVTGANVALAMDYLLGLITAIPPQEPDYVTNYLFMGG